MTYKFCRFGSIILLLLTSSICSASDIVINNNTVDKVIHLGNNKIMITLDYNGKCNISVLEVNGQSVVSGPSGIFSAIKTSTGTYSTLKISSVPTIKIGKNSVTVSNIKYGTNVESVIENWKFLITDNDIRYDIERIIPKPLIIEEAAFSSFNFDNIKTWDGAFRGYGILLPYI